MLFDANLSDFWQHKGATFQSDIVVHTYTAVGIMAPLFGFEFWIANLVIPEEVLERCIQMTQSLLQCNAVYLLKKRVFFLKGDKICCTFGI